MSPHQSSSEATALRAILAETKPVWELACAAEKAELGIPKHDRPLQGSPRNDSIVYTSSTAINNKNILHDSVTVEGENNHGDALQIPIVEEADAQHQSPTHRLDGTHDDSVSDRLHTETTTTAADSESTLSLPLVQADGQIGDGGNGDTTDEDVSVPQRDLQTVPFYVDSTLMRHLPDSC